MVSSQIIDVINELCSKFGIAIDWSQKNVQPYLESLVIKAVNYELYTSIMWIVIGAILFGIGLFYLSKADKCKDKDFYRILAWLLLIIAILFIICNTNDVIKCITFPDKVVFDMFYNYLPTN